MNKKRKFLGGGGRPVLPRFCHSGGACVMCEKNDQYFVHIPCGSGCVVCPACLWGAMDAPAMDGRRWTVCPSCAKPISEGFQSRFRVQHCKGDDWLKTVEDFYTAIIQDDTATMHDIMQTLLPHEQVQLANSCRADYQTTPVLARVLNDLDPDNKQAKVKFLLKYGAKIDDSHRQPGESSTIQDQKSESESESESEKSESWVGELKKAQKAIRNAHHQGAPGVHTRSLTRCIKLLGNILLQEQHTIADGLAGFITYD